MDPPSTVASLPIKVRLLNVAKLPLVVWKDNAPPCFAVLFMNVTLLNT